MFFWEKLLDNPQPRAHVVQLYEENNDRLLARNVGRYFSEGLKRGDGLLAIATREHIEAFDRQLLKVGAEPAEAVRNGRFAVLDAQETLAKFMVDGQPDWRRFEEAMAPVVSGLRARSEQNRLRAYGEMVGVLWKQGAFSAAIRLEEFWNKLLASAGFSLFCAYPIDVFNEEFTVTGVDALLCDHTHLLPTGPNKDIEGAISRAMDETLGARAEQVRNFMKSNSRSYWAVLPGAEALILWIRNNLGDEAEEILTRAREHYQASQQFAPNLS
jgi:hypothetical protein